MPTAEPDRYRIARRACLAVSGLAGVAFDLRALEERDRAAGTYVSQQRSPHAVLLSVQHSGSLRLYSAVASCCSYSA
ncbi:MAG: hypothetical protein AABY89_10000 [Acidobacteriota bacterium]